MKELLIWIGLTRVNNDGRLLIPFHVAPWRSWKAMFFPAVSRREPFIVFFHNRPGFIKWTPGRLLPRRWGIRVLGFEFGDRG